MESIQRIQDELLIMRKDPAPGCSAGPKDQKDLRKWDCVIDGPKDTPYEGGMFHLEIIFPIDYPKKPPAIKFITKIFHPNIRQESGQLCLDILNEKWSEFSQYYTIREVIVSIKLLLTLPNFKSSYGHGGSEIEYKRIAKEWTDKYAKT